MFVIDHLGVMEGTLEYETTNGSEYVEVQGDRPKLVRRRTWTKQDGEMVFQVGIKRKKIFPPKSNFADL